MGVRMKCNSCPVALAMKRAGLLDASAGWYSLDWHNRRSPTPYNVRAFMDRFDHFYTVQPFTFELDATP